MPRASKVCSTTGCPNTMDRGTKRSRCEDCARQAEQRRGSAHTRGYDHTHTTVFRRGVLARHPFCQAPGCFRPSTDADHWPLSRRELVTRRLNPNDPKHGRGLCHEHHSRETAKHQPGGWHANH